MYQRKKNKIHGLIQRAINKRLMSIDHLMLAIECSILPAHTFTNNQPSFSPSCSPQVGFKHRKRPLQSPIVNFYIFCACSRYTFYYPSCTGDHVYIYVSLVRNISSPETKLTSYNFLSTHTIFSYQ